MKKLLMIALTVTAVFGMATSSFAQGAGPRGGAGAAQGQPGQGQRGGGMREAREKMMAELKLTDAQKKQWAKVEKEMRDKMMKEMGPRPGQGQGQPGQPPKPGQGQEKGANRGDRQARMQKMMKIREEFKPKFMAILNADQKKKYEAMEKQMRERWGRGGRPGGGGGGN